MPIYTFTTFDDPSAQTGATSAIGINDSGQIVGGYLGTDNVAHGFLLSGGTYTTLTDPLASDTPSDNGTVATGINAGGQIVGTYDAGPLMGGFHGFIYNPNGGGTYSTLDVPGAISTQVFGINNLGLIVGIYGDAGAGEHGFIYNPNNSAHPFTPLDAPSATPAP